MGGQKSRQSFCVWSLKCCRWTLPGKYASSTWGSGSISTSLQWLYFFWGWRSRHPKSTPFWSPSMSTTANWSSKTVSASYSWPTLINLWKISWDKRCAWAWPSPLSPNELLSSSREFWNSGRVSSRRSSTKTKGPWRLRKKFGRKARKKGNSHDFRIISVTSLDCVKVGRNSLVSQFVLWSIIRNTLIEKGDGKCRVGAW